MKTSNTCHLLEGKRATLVYRDLTRGVIECTPLPSTWIGEKVAQFREMTIDEAIAQLQFNDQKGAKKIKEGSLAGPGDGSP
ncbi:uncharacterized protein LOC121579417 isoform X2 [Coregonus clupeaformis]|uniref:uncharacterized protein LOC121579417 isoform X2 n=1 Tax=Coregonus clupeaformis TaxID=59861 RepID=UPI001BE05447|nr:uncharacterized protein LOC121579417 isoform X2 [Coregonus clupeaformis]XP_041749936.1 uncharacterized protein LOC121579417 isoform X2 [Coregonus clupeaformis]